MEKMGKWPMLNAICPFPPNQPPRPQPHPLHRGDRRIYKTNPDVVSQDKREKKKIYRLAESDPAATSLDR